MKILPYAILLMSICTGIFIAKAETEGSLSVLQRRATITISEQGNIYVGERETPLNRLANRLRRAGVEKTDTIFVSIPDETPRRVLVAVSRELATKGYRRVIFTKPPRASAEAEIDN